MCVFARKQMKYDVLGLDLHVRNYHNVVNKALNGV